MTDYPRCATCKHWDDLFQQHPDMHQGSCALSLAEGDGNVWMKPRHETKASAFILFPDNLGEFQRAVLLTDKDFGCVLHEPKP